MANVAINNITDTWNSSGTTFTGIKFNVTDTSSAAASLLMDLQVGGASKLSVRKDNCLIGNSVATLKAQADIASQSWVFGRVGLENKVQIGAYGISIANGAYFGFCSGDVSAANIGDTFIGRDGSANTFAQRNGANGQTFRLYGNYATASDFRRLKMAMSLAGVAEIKPEDGGTYTGSTVLYISGLPTSNPGPGILWNNGGVVNVGT